jgi:hypothetical protein
MRTAADVIPEMILQIRSVSFKRVFECSYSAPTGAVTYSHNGKIERPHRLNGLGCSGHAHHIRQPRPHNPGAAMMSDEPLLDGDEYTQRCEAFGDRDDQSM